MVAEKTRTFAASDTPDMLRVIGHQWWWEVEYLSDRPYQRFRTANKIHIATDRPAGVALETRDVHAHMAMKVVAVRPEEFERWQQAQFARLSPRPTSSVSADLMSSYSAAACSAMRSRDTPAGARLGPDLTDLAGLTTIAAGALPNVCRHLVAWILDPPSFKPGPDARQRNRIRRTGAAAQLGTHVNSRCLYRDLTNRMDNIP